MPLINPHINFNGNAEEAFTFYKSVFGGEFAKIIRFKDLAGPEFPVAEKEENKIMHIALPIGKTSMLMANDVPEIMGKQTKMRTEVKL
ncbi:MAG: hypothetical protein JWP81_1426 [Ferruginibacter sp.]|nr:hypothetical protein [Ferruginibacter sp.]